MITSALTTTQMNPYGIRLYSVYPVTFNHLMRKEIVQTGWIKGFILGILLVTLACEAASRQLVDQIVIVKSSDNAYFDQTISALIKHVDQGAAFKVVMAPELSEFQDYRDSVKLFVALGQSAVEAVDRLNAKTISINAYLTLEQYNSLNIDGQQTVLLDQPLGRYLAFCKLMLGVDSVGVIAANEFDLAQQQANTLSHLNLTLNQYQVDSFNKLLPVLRDLLQHNDALLMLPRQSIYNRDTLKGVLLNSYRNRKPAVSYSPAHVRSGAVASIYSSPVDIARHLALLVNHSLQNNEHGGPPIQFAKFYSVATNSRVARALGINLPEEQKLRSELDQLSQ